MDLLGALHRIAWVATFVLGVADRFNKMTRCILLRSTTVVTITAALLRYWIYAHGAPQYSLVDSGTQVVAKVFDDVCGILGSEHYIVTACCPQTYR